MGSDRSRTVRRVSAIVILAFEAFALAGIGVSMLFIGAVVGPMMDDVMGDRAHGMTVTMLALGIAGWAAAAVLGIVALGIGTNRGYAGERHAASWRAILMIGLLVETAWIVVVATSTVDPGVAGRAAWVVVLAASGWTGVCVWIELRIRRAPAPPVLPPPPAAAASEPA
jgi:4-hydroxybenzoate polyprenyltransferase